MSLEVSYKKQFTFFIILIIIFAVGIEIILQAIEMIPEQCKLQESELFDKFSENEKQVLCEEYRKMAGDVSYTLAPIRLHIPNQHGNHININSDGFRGEEIKFSEEQYKIFFLGGSTAFGSVTTSDENTIPGQLEKKLKEKGFNVKVVNAGIHSATTIDELYMLENNILKFNPNMVIMYDGYNDAGDFYLKKFHISYDEFMNNNAITNNILHTKNENNKENTGIIKFVEQINYKTGIGLLIFYKNFVNEFSDDLSNTKIKKMNERSVLADSKTIDFIENYMAKNWSKACELGEKHGFQTVNIIQPILGTSDRVISQDEIRIMNQEGFKTHYLTYLKNISIDSSKVVSCNNIVDLRNSFESMNGINVYFDEGHMTDFGYEVMADKITEKLIPLIEKDLSES